MSERQHRSQWENGVSGQVAPRSPIAGQTEANSPTSSLLAGLRLQRIRRLQIDPAQHPQARTHLSATSGLVHSRRTQHAVADDGFHLGVFDDTVAADKPPAPGHLLLLFAGDLPIAACEAKTSSAKLRSPGPLATEKILIF